MSSEWLRELGAAATGTVIAVASGGGAAMALPLTHAVMHDVSTLNVKPMILTMLQGPSGAVDSMEEQPDMTASSFTSGCGPITPLLVDSQRRSEAPWWRGNPELCRLHAAGLILPEVDPSTLELPPLRELKGDGPTLSEMLLEERRSSR